MTDHARPAPTAESDPGLDLDLDLDLDLGLDLDLDLDLDPVSLFTHTVPEAHAVFLAAAADAGLDVAVHRHPLPGPEGEDLHTAVVRVGPAGVPNVVLCLSGVHGAEGHAGSALQIGALRSVESTLARRDDVAVVLVHLLNPWGTAWSRRENEDNIELLRHFSYQHLDLVPNPTFTDFWETMGWERAGTIEEFFACGANIAEVLDRHPVAELGAALSRGQGEHPNAITYHGGPASWSKRLLDAVIDEHLDGARRVVVFDLHTAVGPYGDAVICNNAPPGTEEHELVHDWFDGELVPPDEELRHYRWIGLVRPGTEVVGVICEIGTETLGFEDQHIFPLDTWLHRHGRRLAPENARYVARYRRFFYPETTDWMRLAWPHGHRRWRQLLTGVDRWAAGADPTQKPS